MDSIGSSQSAASARGGSPTSVDDPVRSLTDDEVSFYRLNGWVKVEQLVCGELAAALLAEAEVLMGPSGEEYSSENGGRYTNSDALPWRELRYCTRDTGREPFRSIMMSSTLGRSVQRLFGRPVSVRFSQDLIGCKRPSSAGDPSPRTPYHQDLPSLPMDRTGVLYIWIALNDVPPQRGSMRFFSQSHRAGPLGRAHEAGAGTSTVLTDIFKNYPNFQDDYQLSPPIHLRPGDATIHNGLTVHGAPGNSTDVPRWNFTLSYFPGDTLYTGAQYGNTDGIGLRVDHYFEHPLFPEICPAGNV